MIILFLSGFLGVVLFVLLARYAPPMLRRREQAGASDRRMAIPPAALRVLAAELLRALGLTIVESESDERHLVASKREPFGESRQVVVLAPAPSGVVDQATVVALAEDVKAEHAAVGLLMTPGEISTAGLAGLEVPLELIDGRRFRELIGQYLPSRLGEIDGYRGFGSPPSLPHSA